MLLTNLRRSTKQFPASSCLPALRSAKPTIMTDFKAACQPLRSLLISSAAGAARRVSEDSHSSTLRRSHQPSPTTRWESADENAPSFPTGRLGLKSLTMSYFHTGIRTIIGAEAFHCPVRDAKEWDHLAMVIRHNLLSP